jgi:hypothetical protein
MMKRDSLARVRGEPMDVLTAAVLPDRTFSAPASPRPRSLRERLKRAAHLGREIGMDEACGEGMTGLYLEAEREIGRLTRKLRDCEGALGSLEGSLR